jgi:hypothetical protein
VAHSVGTVRCWSWRWLQFSLKHRRLPRFTSESPDSRSSYRWVIGGAHGLCVCCDLRLLLELPNVADRPGLVGEVRCDGFVRFWQVCHSRTNLNHLRLCCPLPLPNFFLGITGQPRLEDALVELGLLPSMRRSSPFRKNQRVWRIKKPNCLRTFNSPRT